MGDQGKPRVSGAVMIDQIHFMEKVAGHEVVRAALESFPPEQREEVASVTPVSWLDTDVCNEWIVGVARAIGRDPEEFIAEIARRGTERTMHGLWRMMLRFTTDAALVARTPLIYSKTYDRGALSSRIDQPGEARLELTGWPDAPRLELISLAAGIETVLRCAGRKEVVVHWDHRPLGASFRATWTT